MCVCGKDRLVFAIARSPVYGISSNLREDAATEWLRHKITRLRNKLLVHRLRGTLNEHKPFVCARARMGVCVLIMCNLGLQIASEHLKLSNVGIAFDRVGATANNPNIAWNVS